MVNALGIGDWYDLIEYIRQLPYGRLADKNNRAAVLIEGRGTCSSKHAFLKSIADENDVEGVDLIIGIFKMSPNNTPETRSILAENGLEFLPEAHCYLKVREQRIDATKPGFDINSFANDILQEMVINVEQIADFKVNMHKSFLKNWIESQALPHSIEKIWDIREKCIEKISEPK